MTDPTTTDFGTRWRRVAGITMAALIPVGALGFSAAQGVMGLGFVATSSEGQFTTGSAASVKRVGVIVDPQPTKDFDGNVSGRYVVKIAADTMVAKGVCITEKAELLGQTVTLLIQSNDQNIKIDNYVEATVIEASTSLSATGPLLIGKNAADISISGNSLQGVSGEIGIEAGGVQVGLTTGTVKTALITGPVRAVDFKAQVIMDDVDCPPM